ncbi:ornithine cyclodeaminase family protein [Brevibacterium litoralis]|uniref:ornithine cyclodeaminase family protein n=1 Tax=Brevibacterium litoralis TaxID=3138935 RepID=UPI0032EB5FA4
MKHIDADQFNASLDHAGAIEALRDALRSGYDPRTDATRIPAPLSRGQFLFMPSEIGKYAGVKILTVTPDNPAEDNPLIQGSCLLLDSHTHATLALLDGVALTNLRTPAVSLAGVADVLARRFPDGVEMTVVGGGIQGSLHVDAALAVLPVRKATVLVRSAGRGESFLAHCADLGVEAAEAVLGSEAASAALRASGLVVTATPAGEPVVADSDVADDAVVVAMGSHDPGKRELPAALLGRSTVLVESEHTARAEAGDVVMAIADGTFTWDDVLTLREVVQAGGEQVPDDRPFVFKTTGMSWEDLVVASAVYEKNL